MGLQVHFVVYYDKDTGKLIRDDDTAEAHFGQELVFDSRDDEWYEIGNHPGLDMKASAALDAALALYNDVLK